MTAGSADPEPEPDPEPARRRMAGEQRRAQIVAAARDLFAGRGFDATTTREIAAAAGVSDALIYRHFTGKQALLHAVVDAGVERFSRLGPPAGADPRHVPIEQLLTGIGRSFLDALDDQLDLITLLIAQHRLFDGDTRFVEFVDTAAEQLGARIDDHLAPAPDGDTPGRGYLLARAFMGSLVAFVLLQQRLGLDRVRPVDRDAYLRTAVASVVAGLPAAPGSDRDRR